LNATTFSSGTVKGNGAGETIALIEMYHDPNLVSDVHTFDQAYGLPDLTITVDNEAGSQTDNGWSLEESMDVEWAHAVAPGANILVVEAAPSNSDTQALANLMSAVQTASSTPGVVVVSMSWGFSEFAGETAYDSDFMTPGITYVAASGDDPGVDYPSASPYVLSVGGTTLTLDGAGNYVSETAWTDSGGGYSQYEAEPSYQESVQQTGERSTPDVAFDGDPNTGVEVYETPPTGQGQGQHPWQQSAEGAWQVVGGTSLGAPSWAGIIAIVDQGRALAGESSLTGATQTLPSLYDLASDFNPVTPTQPGGVVSNFPWGGFGGGEGNWGFAYGSTTVSGSTANTQTGLGSPIGSLLVDNLVDSTTDVPLTTSTTSTASTPTPTPIPTPSPTPTGGKKHHHHKKVEHPAKKAKIQVHAKTTRSKHVVAQNSESGEDKLRGHDHGAT
ncbi:MAG: hypothetical protein ACLQGP_13295, partial [Isosphaeraceae bacterium]